MPERTHICQNSSLNFIWNYGTVRVKNLWEEGFSNLESFFKENGHTKVKVEYKTKDKYNLGSWVGTQKRTRDKLSPKQIARLDSLGFDWENKDVKLKARWETVFSYLEKYAEGNGDCLVPADHITEDGIKLGSWVSNTRNRKDKLSPEQIAKLDSSSCFSGLTDGVAGCQVW